MHPMRKQAPKPSFLSRVAPIALGGLGLAGGAYAANKGYLGNKAQSFMQGLLHTDHKTTANVTTSPLKYTPSAPTPEQFDSAGVGTYLKNQYRNEIGNSTRLYDELGQQNPVVNELRDRFIMPGAHMAMGANDMVSDKPIQSMTPLIAGEVGLGVGASQGGKLIDKYLGSRAPAAGTAKILGRGLAGMNLVGDALQIYQPNLLSGGANLDRAAGLDDSQVFNSARGRAVMDTGLDSIALASGNPLLGMGLNVGSMAIDAKADHLASELGGMESLQSLNSEFGDHALKLYRATKSPNPRIAEYARKALQSLGSSQIGSSVTTGGANTTPGLADRINQWFNPVDHSAQQLDQPAIANIFNRVNSQR